jgi:hypothetical protein
VANSFLFPPPFLFSPYPLRFFFNLCQLADFFVSWLNFLVSWLTFCQLAEFFGQLADFLVSWLAFCHLAEFLSAG